MDGPDCIRGASDVKINILFSFSIVARLVSRISLEKFAIQKWFECLRTKPGEPSRPGMDYRDAVFLTLTDLEFILLRELPFEVCRRVPRTLYPMLVAVLETGNRTREPVPFN